MVRLMRERGLDMLSKGELLVMKLAGDLDTLPALLMEGDALDIIREEIRKGSDYDAILAAVGEVI